MINAIVPHETQGITSAVHIINQTKNVRSDENDITNMKKNKVLCVMITISDHPASQEIFLYIIYK